MTKSKLNRTYMILATNPNDEFKILPNFIDNDKDQLMKKYHQTYFKGSPYTDPKPIAIDNNYNFYTTMQTRNKIKFNTLYIGITYDDDLDAYQIITDSISHFREDAEFESFDYMINNKKITNQKLLQNYYSDPDFDVENALYEYDFDLIELDPNDHTSIIELMNTQK